MNIIFVLKVASFKRPAAGEPCLLVQCLGSSSVEAWRELPMEMMGLQPERQLLQLSLRPFSSLS